MVLERDGGVCHLCGVGGATTVDHIVPAHLGGTDDLSNLAASHGVCNSRKGARVPLPHSRLAIPNP
jgi:5-methylcytosine-specific restriction endonuclease McrA